MQRFLRPILVAGLVAAMLASSSLAFASGFGFGNAYRSRGGGRQFGDVAGYGWAMAGISALRDQGVLNGVSASQFNPSGLTTRADMATVLGRLLGWQQGGTACGQQFADSRAIPAYARCAVGMAAQRGIMQGLPGGAFMPQGNVTWAQLPVIMARARHYRPAPAADVASLLSRLPQGSNTPAWAAPSVAAAIQAGDFTGILADLYQPSQSVTRAELAAFLEQVEETMTGSTTTSSAAVLTGQVTAVNGTQLTIQSGAGTQTLPMSPSATVYVGQTAGSTANVQAGDTVTLVVAGGEAVDINITAGPSTGTTAGLGNTFTATVLSVTATQLELQVPGVPGFYVPVAPGVSVGGVAAGQTVTVTVNASGQATAISTGTASTNTGTATVSGVVDTVTGNTLLINVNGTVEPYVLTGSTTVDGVLNDLSALTSGQSVTVYETNGQVTDVEITSGGSTVTVSGTIASISGDALVLNVSGTTEDYTLSASTTVDGSLNDLGALAAGQSVTLTVTGTLVSAVQITSSGATTTVTGTVLSLSGNTLLLSVGGTGEAFTLSAATTVNGVLNDFAALTQGLTVTLTEAGGQVTAITTGSNGATSTVTGVVSTISGYTLVLSVNGASQVYTLSASTTVNGAANDLGALAVGETVTLYLSGTLVAAVTTGSNGATSTVTGVVSNISGYTLVLSVNGATQAYTLSASATVNGAANDLGALAIGETVTLYLSGTLVTAVTTGSNGATSTVTGNVSIISGYTLVLSVNGVSQVYTLSASTTVNGAANDLGALAVGETVTLYLSGTLVTAVTTGSNGAANTVSGSVSSISGLTLVMIVNGTTEDFTLTSSTTVNGVAGATGTLEVGDTVTLTLSGGTVLAIEVITTPGHS